MRSRHASGLTSGLALASALAVPAIAFAQPTSPAYPIRLLDAVTQDHVGTDSIIYNQPFQPKSVVKTGEAIHFPLKSHLIFASHPDVSVPDGAMLVEAIYDNQTVYCGAFRQKAPDMNGASDVGFCLRDAAKTGTFTDITYLTPNPDPVLTAYEIHDQSVKQVQWAPAHISYQPVAIDDSLTESFQLQVKSGRAASQKVYASLVWPSRLNDTPQADNRPSPSIAVVWPHQADDVAIQGVPVHDGLNLLPGMAAEFSATSDGETVKWIKTIPSGAGVIGMKFRIGTAMIVSHYAYELLSQEGQ